jgi:hypothetical protein
MNATSYMMYTVAKPTPGTQNTATDPSGEMIGTGTLGLWNHDGSTVSGATGSSTTTAGPTGCSCRPGSTNVRAMAARSPAVTGTGQSGREGGSEARGAGKPGHRMPQMITGPGAG